MSKRKEQDDALGNPPEQKQTEFEAQEEVGAARMAINKQIGETGIPIPKPKSSHVSENEV
jgi:hypothetical protein